MSNNVMQNLQQTAFGELSTADTTPIVQGSASYGILNKIELFARNGGAATAANSMYEVSSGTDPNAVAALLTKRQLSYRSGQGLLCRVTNIFATPQLNSNQKAGMISSTDNLGFGYDGLDFGVVYDHDGENEQQELTITTPAAGSENATVTVDDVGYTVPLTVGTVQHNAFEISESLNSQVPGFDITSNNDQVVLRSIAAEPKGTFSFSSATAIAAFVQIQAGVIPTSGFIEQTVWNVDKSPLLNPNKNNGYQIRFKFWGIEFSIEDPDTGHFQLVHVIKFANQSDETSVTNPTFRVGWRVQNTGNTTPITIKGSTYAGFVEGEMVITEESRSSRNTNPAVTNVTEVNILTLRNRIAFGTIQNRVEARLLSVNVATDTAKGAFVFVRANATISGDLDYQYIDKAESVMEEYTGTGTVSGGRLIDSVVLPPAGDGKLDLSLLLPGDIVTFSGILTAAPASLIIITAKWVEDL